MEVLKVVHHGGGPRGGGVVGWDETEGWGGMRLGGNEELANEGTLFSQGQLGAPDRQTFCHSSFIFHSNFRYSLSTCSKV